MAKDWKVVIDDTGGPYPTEPGHYRVMISGDSESIDGHTIYSFEDYEAWVWFNEPDEDGNPSMVAQHDEEIETVLAWFGPVSIPACDCFA